MWERLQPRCSCLLPHSERRAFRARAFVLLRRASHFLLRGQEKVTKEKATPLARLADILSARSAVGLRGLSTAHPVLTPNWSASMRTTLRAFLRPPAATEGPRVEQRAILARTFQKSQIKSKAVANRYFALAFAFQLSSLSAGQDGPLLYPGPLCGGESGTTGRAAGVDRDADSFSPGQDALSKSPAPAHGLAGQDARQAPSGVALSLWLLSL